ncbi:aspartate/glutamate racemase family protein [Phaeobacter italicus]|uniref:amino acid racemase n=1 Tax=Phaeobacter italicus TaxID=481446 RepID=UPI001ADC5014|nr:amino acid racemase [Phaeobacter italicus]MBO9442582.1 aspartate/glutamate racemase family protein [Phaeobacter italicus]
MAKTRLKLGIVGGLGARGGADILAKLVAQTPVRSESDHREILFEQKPLTEAIPVSDPRYQPTHRKFYVFDTLSRMAKNGCDAALLPCFISHTFLEELRPELPLQLVSLYEAIQEELRQTYPQARKIGLLTTPFVQNSNFVSQLNDLGREVLFPSPAATKAMLNAIYGPKGFKAGAPLADILSDIEPALTSLQEQGADLILPAMTELPVLLNEGGLMARYNIPDVNASYARFALAQTTEPPAPPFKIGVVGGVGPAATVDFFRKVVTATAAKRDQDHIKILIEQNPQIPDRTDNLLHGGIDPTLALYATCQKLVAGGAKLIAIPCNTAHAFVDAIQPNLRVPIVHMLSETVRAIRRTEKEGTKVAVLATDGTIQSGLYQDRLKKEGLVPVVPSPTAQRHVMDAIYGPAGVKAGFTSGESSEKLITALEDVAQQGARIAILGCTELPLVEIPDHVAPGIRPVDPTKILAEICVANAVNAAI